MPRLVLIYGKGGHWFGSYSKDYKNHENNNTFWKDIAKPKAISRNQIFDHLLETV
jgi:hypothetical protein